MAKRKVKKKFYAMLFIRIDGKWTPQFGAWKSSDVVFERDEGDWRDTPLRDKRILALDDARQKTLDAALVILNTPRKEIPIVPLSERVIAWLDNFSQSAAIDMGEGGDDAVCVAECCLTVLGVDKNDKPMRIEIDEHIRLFGYREVLKACAAHVRTL